MKRCMKYFRPCILGILLLFIIICRFVPAVAEWYALYIYPIIASILSGLSAVFPFSLEEILVLGLAALLILMPIIGRIRKHYKWRKVIICEVELVLWIYVWFYMGWGINYFRHTFFVRAEVHPAQYDETEFKHFLSAYTDSLNSHYTQEKAINKKAATEHIKAIYDALPHRYGLQKPDGKCYPKKVLFTSLYSGVGVLGYMGPFFNEMQLNGELPPLQYPFTYAHELSHLLGISSEAEANFWAYKICTSSSIPAIQYSGYFGLLPYVIVNARMALNKEDYKSWAQSIRAEIINDFNSKNRYWEERYSPLIGMIQEKIYDWFLKGNNISSGQKNYAEVIHMLISFERENLR